MDNCIFCKIAAGEIPALTLFEDEDVKVIFDAGPATKGHALVIPKAHAANVFEISDELLAKAHVVAKKVAIALKEATECEGVNILQNNGEMAGQSVFHLHIHVIPRYEGDTANIKWIPGEQDVEYLNGLIRKVTNILK
ncbi:HIT family protein [uncultured Eubacterium sp.]|uniref:HIT family protein n=1 Tax=uncultured Eubacterium sp. TaxID=165185 RepID=UPI0026725EF9|nr:HIT family protein [uncultured Eubacterium sp.]